ncbi:DUF2510 domain-containing protein [Microbacterium sp. 3J1]|uniref:DUF2510 domain-containing protein n=1 Tax=Microbacterium sp. 3J1 TaxID=861269 RepID=UPI000B192EA5|nr:DUF2510 domain-containing protein [Microbacterium sp. 3J1]
MTTPAGWYDDGSGRLRWWDGVQWTEHFAPSAESAGASADETPADAVTSDSLGSVAAVEAGATWSGQDAERVASADPQPSTEQPSTDQPAQAEAPQPEAQPQQPEPEQVEPEVFSSPAPDQSPNAYSATPDASAAAPAAQDAAQSWQSPAYPDAAPTYPGTAPSYPGAAPQYSPPSYPGAAADQGYPAAGAYQAAPGYGAPAGYPVSSEPSGPSRLSVVGLVGLGLAALGTILSCIPVTFIFGWILLAAGFIVSLISLFLRGKKWPGVAGLILSVVGTIVAVIVAIVFVTASFADAVRDLPTAPPSSDTGTDDGTTDEGTDDGTPDAEIVEGTLGEPVTVTQMGGTAEVTITSATWKTDDGSGVPSTNGGFVVLEATWTGIDGTSSVSPLFLGIETAEGAEGEYDYFVDGLLSEQVTAGQTVSGTLTFDVAQSSSYTVVLLNELLQDVARISVTPTAG